MLVVFDSLGNLKMQTAENVYQGSNKANTVFIIVPQPPSVVLMAKFILPNGKATTPIVVPVAKDTGYLGFKDSNGEQMYVWAFEVSAPLTAYAGILQCQIDVVRYEKVLNENLEIVDKIKNVLATYTFDIEVKQGVPPIEVTDINSYDGIIQALNVISEAISNNFNEFDSKFLLATDIQDLATDILVNVKCPSTYYVRRNYTESESDYPVESNGEGLLYTIRVSNNYIYQILFCGMTTPAQNSNKLKISTRVIYEFGGSRQPLSNWNSTANENETYRYVEKNDTVYEISDFKTIFIEHPNLPAVAYIRFTDGTYSAPPKTSFKEGILYTFKTYGKTGEKMKPCFVFIEFQTRNTYYGKFGADETIVWTQNASTSEVDDLRVYANSLESRLNNLVLGATELFIFVNELPETGEENKIYLVPITGENAEDPLNTYEEYIWINDEWEYLGQGGLNVDLSKYVQFTDFASSNKAGVVQVDTEVGTTMYLGSKIGLSSATVSDIELRASGQKPKPITLENVDFATQETLTNPTNGASWTNEKKTSACETIGAVRKNGENLTVYGEDNGANFTTIPTDNNNAIPSGKLARYLNKSSAGSVNPQSVLVSSIPEKPYQVVPKTYIDNLPENLTLTTAQKTAWLTMLGLQTETWTFTLEDGTTVTKKVVLI